VLPDFLERISGRDVNLDSEISTEEIDSILGGHTEGIIRRRRGQRASALRCLCDLENVVRSRVCSRLKFSKRSSLQFCEASGASKRWWTHIASRLPRIVRRQTVAVNPETLKIEIAPRLFDYPTYRNLDGSALQIEPGNGHPLICWQITTAKRRECL